MAPSPTRNDSGNNNNDQGSSNRNGSTTSTTQTRRITASTSGTVPKIITPGAGGGGVSVATPKTAAVLRAMQQQQQAAVEILPAQQQQFGQQNNRSSPSPLHIVTSLQQQRKNTEVVAPIRRDFKDLNEYLLSKVTSSEAGSSSQAEQQQQGKLKLQNNQSNQFNNNNYNGDLGRLQHHQFVNESSTNLGGSYDLESSRYCYPVRPIPRRNQQQLQQHHHQHQPLQQQQLHQSSNQQQQYYQQQLQQQTVGIVIPTTPQLTTASTNQRQQQQQQQRSLQQPQYEDQQQPQQQQNGNLLDLTANSNLTDWTLSQRLHLLQQFLHLTNKISNNNTQQAAQASCEGRPAVPQLTAGVVLSNNRKHPQSQQKHQEITCNMVHEINPSGSQEAVVNSASLENVALSESSDRAQSIQSLHSAIDTPTPDNTPSYDELQQRLEASNRNIMNMQEQQQQLLRLQHAAKQHLSEMEQLRQHSAKLSFGPNTTRTNGAVGAAGDAPEYESIEQVHTDMATLAGRMKNLTAFIHNQNELSNILGEDGPEIMAEQQALQDKLESLRVQRDEMRNLVDELQDINRTAEQSVNEARNRERSESADATPTREMPSTSRGERIVPVEFSRIVPIDLLHGPAHAHNGASGGTDELVDTDTAELIRQKAADVEKMKSQLKLLKDMMETVNLIDEHTVRDTKPMNIGVHDCIGTPPSVGSPTASLNGSGADEPTSSDAFIVRKVRMLNEVTSDLRSQAESLQAERERIKALKEEIVRRKEQAAAAAQMGTDALKRNSLTPTPRSHPSKSEALDNQSAGQASESAQLKADYEAKKKEFERLCRSLQNVDESQSNNSVANSKLVSEADDECEEESKFLLRNEARKQVRIGGSKSSLETSTANAVTASGQDVGASLEATSMQSDSSRYSMPPPMPAVGSVHWPQPPQLPNAWQSDYFYGSAPSPSPLGVCLPGQARPFTPPHCIDVHSMPSAPVATTATAAAVNGATTLGTVAGTASSTASTSAALPTAESMMLQQFAQTQQMLINSICQCNQMLWHQQHEIDNLKHTIHMVQERLVTLNIPVADLGFSLRAESVPPPPLSGPTMANNYFLTHARAQSEQPLLQFQPRGSSFTHYAPQHAQQQHHLQQQQQQHLYQQRQLHSLATTAGYNYSSETQQQNASTNTRIYSTLNNATATTGATAATQPPPPPQHCNNETAQSPLSAAGAGPGPIFMHHHNNAIHQNNANLRTQNHYANNLQQQQNNTLNNQVPPGNRANNYWDNFRSYSRQNLLSTNSSNKSNEEQQQQQTEHQVPYQTAVTTAQQQQQPLSITTNSGSSANHDALSQLVQQQAETTRNCYPRSMKVLSNNCNNLNMDSNICAAGSSSSRSTNNINVNKYLQHQQYRQQNMLPYNNLYHSNMSPATASNNWPQNENVDNELYAMRQQPQQHYNIVDNADDILPATVDTIETLGDNISNISRNMNMNNSPHYQRNKLPAKQTYRTQQQLDEYTVGLGQQQQPQQQRLARNQQQRYGDDILPLAQHSYNRRPNRERDFLLRAAIAERNVLDPDVDEVPQYNYNDYNMPHGIVGLAGTYDEDDNCDGGNDEDDTTSEEIKRNLLVNALKNDKFTTKFYESIKEDVFRRLESMLLETESIKEDVFRRLEGMPQQKQQLYNDVNNISRTAASAMTLPRDPLRKLYLNARMNRQSSLRRTPLEHLQLDIDEEPEENSSNNNSAETESNKADDTMPVSDTAPENEKPEDEDNADGDTTPAIEHPFELLEMPTTSALNWRKNIGESVKKLTQVCRAQQPPPSNRNNNTGGRGGGATKKRKSQRGNREAESGGTCIAENANMQPQQHITAGTGNVEYDATAAATTDYELIRYVLQRIHNETHAHMEINDTLILEIAKMTAIAAQKAANIAAAAATNATLPATLLSPKKIYAQIKKMRFPRQRDEFMNCYCNFLESLFCVDQSKQQQQAKVKTVMHKADAITANVKINDADLAEADQLCSPNTTNNNNSTAYMADNSELLMQEAAVAVRDQKNQTNRLHEEIASDGVVIAAAVAAAAGNDDDETVEEEMLHVSHMHVEQEVENNENPEEEGAAAAANANNTFDSPKQSAEKLQTVEDDDEDDGELKRSIAA